MTTTEQKKNTEIEITPLSHCKKKTILCVVYGNAGIK